MRQTCDQISIQISNQIFDQILKQICDQIFEAARKAPFLVKKRLRGRGQSFSRGYRDFFGSVFFSPVGLNLAKFKKSLKITEGTTHSATLLHARMRRIRQNLPEMGV